MADIQLTQNTTTNNSGHGNGPFSIILNPDASGLRSIESVKIPRRLKAWSRTAFLIFILLVVTVSFVPWTQTITVQGRLSSYLPKDRPQEIHAQINGKIVNWHVNEGDEVNKNDLILSLGDINPRFMAPDLIHRLDESRQALEQQKKAAQDQAEILSQRIKEMEALAKATNSSAQARVSEADNKVLNAEQRLAPAEGNLETAQLNLERLRALREKGLVSQRELELAIQAVTEAKAEVKAVQAKLNEAQEGRRALAHQSEQIDAELIQRLLDTKSKRVTALSDFAKASKELADLELNRSNALERQKAGQVIAPFDGKIVRISPIGQGEIVHSGDLLFTLVPQQVTPAIEMWSNAIDAPLLKPGRPVRILFNGVPAIPLPAWPEFMAGTYDGTIQVVDQAASTNGQFRFWVTPDTKRREWPPQQNVRQGTRVIGWVILNRVPLWYEIWRRFNLFPADYESGDINLKELFLPKAGRPRK